MKTRGKTMWCAVAILFACMTNWMWAEESIDTQLRNVDREIARERASLTKEERAAAKKQAAERKAVNTRANEVNDDDNDPTRKKDRYKDEDTEVNYGGRSSRDRREARERPLVPPQAKTMLKTENRSSTQAPGAAASIMQSKESKESKELTHWINTKSKVRHNKECRYYGKGKNGKPCGPNEGRACKVCGG